MNKKLFAVFAATLCLIIAGRATADTRPTVAPKRAAYPGWSKGRVGILAARFANSQKTQEIVFGASRHYDHKSGWFSVAVPSNWNVTDKSGDGEVIVSFADPTANGILVIRVYQPSKGYTQPELGELLKSFLNDRMSSFDGFTMGELKSQRDASLGLYFKYNSIMEGVTYKMYGDAFIEQHNGLVGVVALIMPQEQYEPKQKAAYEMMNSFRVTGTAP